MPLHPQAPPRQHALLPLKEVVPSHGRVLLPAVLGGRDNVADGHKASQLGYVDHAIDGLSDDV